MKRVLVTTSEAMAKALPRQTPLGKAVWGDYSFVFSSEVPDGEEFDFWVVRNKFVKRPSTVRVAPENTILMLSEPRDVVCFTKSYVNQFGVVVSCQDGLKHPDVRYSIAALPWFLGIDYNGHLLKPHLNYEGLKELPITEKTRLLQVITSDKSFTPGHLKRVGFVKKLIKRYGDRIDLYGSGYNGFEDKFDVLMPYKFSLAIENASRVHYVTEKLTDCFLTRTVPLYYGAPNVEEYFGSGAYEQIDINDSNRCFRLIDRVLDGEVEYADYLPAIERARNLVIEKYNILNVIAEVCDTLDSEAKKRNVTIKPMKTLLNWHNFIGQTFVRPVCKLWALR